MKLPGCALGFVATVLAGTAGGNGLAADGRLPWTSNHVIGSPNPPAPYAIERVFPKLEFEHPVDFAFVPGSSELWVADQSARLWSCALPEAAASNPSNQPKLILDLRRHHRPLDNILGFTFHPGFATNHFVFINYNEPGGRTNGAFVSRFTVNVGEGAPQVDAASERVLLRWLSGGHNGCTLAFGNDGFLYISAGDAANPDPPDFPYRTGQDISDLLASVLRIDVDHTEGGGNYAIPADNPFRQTPGARPEVWAFGFRNPFRMSFDRPTGDLWVGDVGWEKWEMIHRVVRGGNYGWSIVEGPNPNVRTDVPQGPGPILPPVVSLPHTEAASITGGVVYHGSRLAKLSGAYLYGDWETGKFWALRHRNGVLTTNDELCDTALKPVAFTLDPHGEVLILDYNGGLYRFVPNEAPPANESFPRRLSATGLFTSLQPMTPAPGTVPYTIRAAMWNDYATAEWLLGVPGADAIATQGGVGNIAGATWFFPSNTVLARTLTLEMESGRPASRRRIETQLLHWDGQAWNPYSYRWTADQSDAFLVSNEGTNDLFKVVDPAAPGGERPTPWRFAARAECLRCHNAWAGEALTLNWLQLGGAASASNPPPTPRATEWSRLLSLGVLRDQARPAETPELADPYEASTPVAARARSWLHVNCATCHRFGAGGTAAIHLNLEKSLKEMRAIDERPLRGEFGLVGARIIAAGDPCRSTLFYRISTEGAGRMPHIGSRLVDPAGLQAVGAWIQSLPASPAVAADPSTAQALAGQNEALLGQAVPRADTLAKLLATPNGALALLARLSPRPTERSAWADAWRLSAATAAARHTNALVRDLCQRLLPPAERRRTLGLDFDPQQVLGLTGRAERGRELFHGMAQCAQCHQCESQGRAFGPDLTAVTQKYSRAQLLEQVLFPSRVIAPEFKTTTATLRDDTEVRGFVLRRTATELVLRDDTLAERTLRLADVKETHESTVSVMPEGLLAPLTAQEAADLIAYLAAPRPGRPPESR
jgi:putative heme-binding domain-containing protein